MTHDNKTEFANELYKAILTLQTVEECDAFFTDLCTINEINTITQRYMVAVNLKKNKVYSEISEQTGASTATISRVKRSLYGAKGYETVFARLGLDKDE